MSLTLQPTRKAAAIAAVAFATALAGCGSSGTSTASTGNGAAAVTQNGAPQGTSPGQGGRGGMGFDTAALAKALGVTEAKLTAAMQSARPSGGQRPSGTTPPTTPGQGGPGGGAPGGGDMFASIAKALGISEAKVRKAFQSVMPAGGQGGPPNGRGGAPAATTPSGTAS